MANRSSRSVFRVRTGSRHASCRRCLIVDHGMNVQEVVEAPRVFSWGLEAEIERGFPESVRAELAARGHDVVPVDHVGGGMCAIMFSPDGGMTGAGCWRADGVPAGIGGGLARANTS